MNVMQYTEWFDKYGADYGDTIQNWLENRPLSISLKSLEIFDIDDFIMEQLHEAYEDYLGECEDRAYEEFRDERL